MPDPILPKEPLEPSPLRLRSGATREDNTMPQKDTQAILKKLDTIEETVTDMKKTLDYLSAEYHDLLKKVDSLASSEAANSGKIKKLELENSKMIKETANLHRQLQQMEQYGRNKNLEIHNVKETKDEKVMSIVLECAKMINIPLEPQDIEAAHRLKGNPKNRRPPPILVQLKSRTIRDKLTAKKKTGLASKNLVSGGDDTPIFINENLNQFHKELFWKSRNWAKENNYKYCWVKHGKIWLRKLDGEDALQISDFEDLSTAAINAKKLKKTLIKL